MSVALAARGGAGPIGRRVAKVRAVRLHGVLREAVSVVASERRDGLRIGPVAASAHRVPQPATALSVGRDALKTAPVAASAHRDGSRIAQVVVSADLVPRPASAASVARDVLKTAQVAASAHRDGSRIVRVVASAGLAPRPATAASAHRDASKIVRVAVTAHPDALTIAQVVVSEGLVPRPATALSVGRAASKTAPAASTEPLAAQARNAPPVVSETAPSARPAASTATPTAAPRANSVETVHRAATAASAGHLLDHAPEQAVLRKPVRAASVRRAASAMPPIARVSAASADHVATAPRVASKANAESVENEALRSP